MTARPGGDRRTIATAAAGTGREWTMRSLCRTDLRFSDGPFGARGDRERIARQLAHLCRAHCPVIEECAAETIGQAPARPVKAVRAGVFFPSEGRPRVLADTGCGRHCAGLPAVHAELAVGR
jgi:hypothetical protein